MVKTQRLNINTQVANAIWTAKLDTAEAPVKRTINNPGATQARIKCRHPRYRQDTSRLQVRKHKITLHLRVNKGSAIDRRTKAFFTFVASCAQQSTTSPLWLRFSESATGITLGIYVRKIRPQTEFNFLRGE